MFGIPGSDEGPEVWIVKELGEADNWAHADASWIWCQNDEKSNGGKVGVKPKHPLISLLNDTPVLICYISMSSEHGSHLIPHILIPVSQTRGGWYLAEINYIEHIL